MGCMHPNVHSSIIYNCQGNPSVHHTHIYTYIYIYNGMIVIKEWNIAICSNIDRVGRQYIKWDKSDRERQICDITFMWNLKNTTSEYNKKVDSQIQRINYWLSLGRGKEKWAI